jgi:glycosyltransferase involved in cell wall biosynthesis
VSGPFSAASSSSESVCATGMVNPPIEELFSLILCTRGRTEELKRFFVSTVNQVGDIPCEVIVVDQNTDERIAPIIEAFEDRLRIKHIRSGTGLSRGRNLALQCTRGSIIAFPDDDCAYPKTLLRDVSGQFTSLPTAHGIAIMSRDFDGKPSGPRWGQKQGWITKNKVFRQAISYGLFFRAGLIRQVGGFDESLGIGSESSWQSGEETDYVLRALAQGFRIFYCPSLFSLHRGGQEDESHFPKQVKYAAGGGRLVRLHTFSWMFRVKFFAAPLLRAIFDLLRLAPRRSKWQLEIGLARWRGFSSRKVQPWHLRPQTSHSSSSQSQALSSQGIR